MVSEKTEEIDMTLQFEDEEVPAFDLFHTNSC